MNAMQSLCLMFTLVAGSAATCSKPVDCCPDVCVLDDECTSNGGGVVYSNVACGRFDFGTSMDPLCIPSVNRKEGQISYKLTNVEVKGLCECKVTKLSLDTNKSTFQQYLSCPKLQVKYQLQTSDSSCNGPIDVAVSLTARNYEIRNNGDYGVFVSTGDNSPHFYLQSVCTSVRIVGDVEYSVTFTCGGSPNTAAFRTTDQILGDLSDIIVNSMEFTMIGIDKYFKVKSMGVVFPAPKLNIDL